MKRELPAGAEKDASSEVLFVFLILKNSS